MCVPGYPGRVIVSSGHNTPELSNSTKIKVFILERSWDGNKNVYNIATI
jgi:hypothetical protein